MGVINLDQATKEDLLLIPNIGPVKAAKIIELREEDEGLTMERLVVGTGIGQDVWAKLYADKVITVNLPAVELQLPGVPRREYESVSGEMREMNRVLAEMKGIFLDFRQELTQERAERMQDKQSHNEDIQNLEMRANQRDQGWQNAIRMMGEGVKADLEASTSDLMGHWESSKEEIQGSFRRELQEYDRKVNLRIDSQKEQLNHRIDSQKEQLTSEFHVRGEGNVSNKVCGGNEYGAGSQFRPFSFEKIKEPSQSSAIKQERGSGASRPSGRSGDEGKSQLQINAERCLRDKCPDSRLRKKGEPSWGETGRHVTSAVGPEKGWGKGKEKKTVSSDSDSENDDENTSDSSDNVSDSEDENERSSEESSSHSQERKHHRRGKGKKNERRRSPPPPRMETFQGEHSRWRSFYFQFKLVARASKWGAREKLERLLSCMREKAVEYIETRPSSVRHSYKYLIRDMKRRYGVREPATASRRQLAYVKQEEEEDLEEFAERVHKLAIDGHPGVKDSSVQSIAVDAFFRGGKEKLAAVLAIGSKPRTIQKAVRKMKEAIQDQKTIGKPFGSIRQVNFLDKSPSPTLTRKPDTVLTVSPSAEELSAMIAEAVKKALEHSQVPSASAIMRNTPGSPRACFTCGDKSHFARECPQKSSLPRVTPPGSPNRSGCFSCGESGHYARECPKKNSTQFSPRNSPSRSSTTLNR